MPFKLPSWRMSDRSLFALLLRSPWWLSALIAVAVSVTCYQLFPVRYAGAGAASGLPFAVIAVLAAWRSARAPSAAERDAARARLAAMSSRDFTQALTRTLTADGYLVAPVPGEAADWRLTRGSQQVLLSHRRWKAASHGIEPLRALAAARDADAHASGAFFVALNPPNDAARDFAARQNITLICGDDLLHRVQPDTTTSRGARR